MPCNKAKGAADVCSPTCCNGAVCCSKQNYKEILKNVILNGIFNNEIK